MKVYELIGMLKNCNSDAEVVIAYEGYNPVRDGNTIADVIEINEIVKGKTTVAIVNA